MAGSPRRGCPGCRWSVIVAASLLELFAPSSAFLMPTQHMALGKRCRSGSLEIGWTRNEVPCATPVPYTASRARRQVGYSPQMANAGSESSPRILIVGGTGRIGTAVATHLAQSASMKKCGEIVLAGRDGDRGQSAVEEVVRDALISTDSKISFLQVDWKDSAALEQAVGNGRFDAVINTAGPYLNVRPAVLKSAITAKVPCYVDVADPLEYIDEALAMSADAKAAGTCALVASGAFPGFSNLLALETARMLGPDEKTRDVKFNYFTAGLGGSGAVNLYITNIGFGEPIETLESGTLRQSLTAGEEFEQVDFFLDSSDPTYNLIGTVNTWAWPFPEGRTVAEALRISGSSRVAMGTAPEIWNVIMGAMVKVVPRSWWRSDAFSQVPLPISRRSSEPCLLLIPSYAPLGTSRASRSSRALWWPSQISSSAKHTPSALMSKARAGNEPSLSKAMRASADASGSPAQSLRCTSSPRKLRVGHRQACTFPSTCSRTMMRGSGSWTACRARLARCSAAWRRLALESRAWLCNEKPLGFHSVC